MKRHSPQSVTCYLKKQSIGKYKKSLHAIYTPKITTVTKEYKVLEISDDIVDRLFCGGEKHLPFRKESESPS